MKTIILLLLGISIFLIQGCSQINVLETLAQPKEEKLLEIQNIDELNEKINLFINDKYTQDLSKKLLLGINYDTEYVNTVNKTEIFIKYKNSMLFCGSAGCSGEMLEYENSTLRYIESFTLIASEIYLVHKLSEHGFEKVVIPMSYINKEEEQGIYYNIYKPFSSSENENLYPADIGYEELKSIINDRKESIKLFDKVE